ncbi:glycosyltransferase [Endothiovibrio diazotrophicus]
MARYELSVIVPTYNERENLPGLVAALECALVDVDWQLIVVDDDSPDGTAERVRQLARDDDRLRCLQRIGRRGLSSACVEGVEVAEAPLVAVMDADLQHDERLLPRMVELLCDPSIDLVIGSRHVAGGSVGGGLSRIRRGVSAVAAGLSRLVLRAKVKDPMSGFFMIRRERFLALVPRLSAKGYKILLDLMASSPEPLSFRELPYVMRPRQGGTSKLDSVVVWDYLSLLLEKMAGGLLPARFIQFVAVGASGVVVHLTVLGLLHRVFGIPFLAGQGVAAWVAMTSNYLLNNRFTYHDRRLHGAAFWRGLLSFYAACLVGAVVNVAVADLLFGAGVPWWAAGFLGAVAGAVWNYVLTAHLTWGRGRR